MISKRMLGTGLAIFLVLAILLSLSAAGFAAAKPAPKQEKVEVFIGFTKTPGQAEQALVRAFGGEINYTYHIIPAIAAKLPAAAIEGLLRNPNVTVIEPVTEAYLVDYETELSNTWGVKKIGAGVPHSEGYCGNGLKVAIIDSGVYSNHSDLMANYAGGYDTGENDDNPMDNNGHGTHVAGTVGAVRNNAGVVGAAPEASIYALKISSANGSITYDAIVAALEWASINGIKVTNNSYGSSGHPGTLVEQAFNDTYKSGMLHVAAAGNSGNRQGVGDNVIYPARFASVIAVAASDSNNKRATFSSTGPAVELIAPGVSINSTLRSGGYGTMSGTSMASPHVAGVAALIWAVNPSLTNAQVRGILQNTAQDLSLNVRHQGSGLVRADEAVAAALGTAPPAPLGYIISVSANPETWGTVIGGGTFPEGTSVTVTASSNDGYQFVNWTEGGTEVSSNEDYTFMVKNDLILVANFEEKEIVQPLYYDLIVEMEGQGTTNPEAGVHNYLSGTEVNLSVTAAAGWKFEKWVIDGVVEYLEETSVVMDGNKSAKAYFIEEVKPPVVGTLNVTVQTDKDTYTSNSWVNITVKVTDQDYIAVNGAIVTVTVNDPVDNVLATYSGTTSADGIFTTRYRVPNKATGIYTIKAWSSLGTLESTATDVTFEVTAR